MAVLPTYVPVLAAFLWHCNRLLPSRRLLRNVRNYLQHGSLIVPAIAVSMMLATCVLLGLDPHAALLLAGAAGSFLVYLIERVLTGGPEDAVNQPERVRWLQEHRTYVRVSMVLAIGCIGGAAYLLRPVTLLVGALLGGVGLLYGLPLFPRQGRLKAVWFLKPLLIAGTWSVGVVVLPAIESGMPIEGSSGASLAALAAYRFLYIVPNVVAGDWLDRRGDAGMGLRTVATMLPHRRVRHLAASVLLVAVGFGVACLLAGWLPALLMADLAGALVFLAMLLRVGARGGRARFLYDALLVWPVLTYLLGLVAA